MGVQFSMPYEFTNKCVIHFPSLQIIDHINKVSTVRKCSFISAASDILSAKISGTFKRFNAN